MLGYAVCAMHYEYDDNYYNASGGFEPPTKIFKDREVAQAHKFKKIREWFMDIDVGTYFQCRENLISEEGYNALVEMESALTVHDEVEPLPKDLGQWDNLPEEFDKYFKAAISSMDDQKFAQFCAEYIDSPPYQIMDVEIED
jgi:hypothetical protein